MSYVLYMLECADGTVYTGVTTDMVRRLKEHNGIDGAKGGAKYTNARRPVRLVYQESYDSRSSAQKREAELKRMTRAQKLALVRTSET